LVASSSSLLELLLLSESSELELLEALSDDDDYFFDFLTSAFFSTRGALDLALFSLSVELLDSELLFVS